MNMMKIQYIQPHVKMIQMGNSGEFFMESGPDANDQTDPTKGGNGAKEFDNDVWNDNDVWGTESSWETADETW